MYFASGARGLARGDDAYTVDEETKEGDDGVPRLIFNSREESVTRARRGEREAKKVAIYDSMLIYD